MLDRYIDRPNLQFLNGKYQVIDSMCYAEFLSRYSLKTKPKLEEENDSQPEILKDIISEIQVESTYPKTLPLMSSKEKLSLRKEKCVLRYHVPSKEKNPEGFAHHLLLMFYPFRKESELKGESSGTYTEKLLQQGVIEVINENKRICEPFGELVEEAVVSFHENAKNLDPFAEQDEVLEELSNVNIDSDEEMNNETENVSIIGSKCSSHLEPEISDDELSAHLMKPKEKCLRL